VSIALPLTHIDLPSFPTRRSSDLAALMSVSDMWPLFSESVLLQLHRDLALQDALSLALQMFHRALEKVCRLRSFLCDRSRDRPRSEEHTSELQSRSDIVCRLLLEK